MPTYLYQCNTCQHEWEEFRWMYEDPPTICPECKVEGKVNIIITGGSGRGIVKLTGHELQEKIKQDAASMGREVYKNENKLANLVGESKYHANELDRSKR